MTQRILIDENTIIKNVKDPGEKPTELIPGRIETISHPDGSVKIIRNVTRVGSLEPRPLYYFRYGEVKCTECGWKGQYGDLKADVAPDGEGGELYSDTICPSCGTWDCLDVFEKETIEECLERTGINENDLKTNEKGRY